MHGQEPAGSTPGHIPGLSQTSLHLPTITHRRIDSVVTSAGERIPIYTIGTIEAKRLKNLLEGNIIRSIIFSIYERGPMHVLFYLYQLGAFIQEQQEKNQLPIIQDATLVRVITAIAGIALPIGFTIALFYSFRANMRLTLYDIDNHRSFPPMPLSEAITSGGVNKLARVLPAVRLARALHREQFSSRWYQVRRAIKMTYINLFLRTISSSTILTSLLTLILPNLQPWQSELQLTISVLLGTFNVTTYLQNRRLYHLLMAEIIRAAHHLGIDLDLPHDMVRRSLNLSYRRLSLSAGNYSLYGASIALLWLTPILKLINANSGNAALVGIGIAALAGFFSALEGWRFEQLQQPRPFTYEQALQAQLGRTPLQLQHDPIPEHHPSQSIASVILHLDEAPTSEHADASPPLEVPPSTSPVPQDRQVLGPLLSIRCPRNFEEIASVILVGSWVVYLSSGIDNYSSFFIGQDYKYHWDIFFGVLAFGFILSAIEQLTRLPREAHLNTLTQALTTGRMPNNIRAELAERRQGSCLPFLCRRQRAGSTAPALTDPLIGPQAAHRE